jgi:hypothetical protein
MPDQIIGAPPARGADRSMVLHCDRLQDLVQAGLEERAELAIWRRIAPPMVLEAFGALELAEFEDVRLTGAGEQVFQTAAAHLRALGWPIAATGAILADLGAALQCLGSIEAACTFRLEHVTDDACRKFHKDETGFRLITTYLGRGTQWCDRAVGKSSDGIRELPAFAMAMLLGQRCHLDNRILHRSPPIEATGEARLVMVLDIERPDVC